MRYESLKTKKETPLSNAKTTPSQAKPKGSALTPASVLHLQKAIGNRAVLQMMQVIQRKPGDFGKLMPAKWKPGYFEKSTPWTEFHAALQAYAAMKEDSQDRIKTFQQLQAKRVAAQAYLSSLNMPKNEDEAAVLEGKMLFLQGLSDTIAEEWKAMTGSLSGDVPPASDEPELLEEQKEQEVNGAKIIGGVFKQQADLVDATGKVLQQVQAGIVCEIHDDKSAPAGLNADDYWKVKPNLTIGNASANFQQFPEGYVQRTAVTLTNRLKQNVNLVHRPETRPLFPHPPVMEDVTQGGIGDCYLLAAVQSIVKTKKDHFPSHMVDNGDTVTVCLYDVANNGGNKTFTPRHITVQKTSVFKKAILSEKEAYASGPIWVHMLEKAYTAAKFSGTDAEQVPLSSAAYGTIAGGYGDVALEHLLGKPTGSKQISSMGDHITPDTFEGLLLGQLAKIGIMVNYNEDYKKACAMYIKMEQVRREDVVRILEEINQPSFNEEDVLNNLDMLPGKRGTAKYTDEQNDVFEEVKQRIDANQPVTVGSKKKIVTGQAGVGLNSEDQGKGLVGTHAYSVIEYEEKNGIKRVKLRNPWGSYGRKYEQKGQKIKAVEDKKAGEFWLDLHDFTKRFTRLYFEA